MAQPVEEENNLEHQLQRLNDLFQNFVHPPQRPMMRDHYNPAAVAIEPRVRIPTGGPDSEPGSSSSPIMAQPVEEENNLEHQLQRLNDLFQNFVHPPQRPMMRDHYNLAAVAIEPRVRIPIEGLDSELKPNMTHAIPKFHGLNSEDPFQHIKN